MTNIGNLFLRLFVISLLAFRYFSTIVSFFGAEAAPFFFCSGSGSGSEQTLSVASAPAPAPHPRSVPLTNSWKVDSASTPTCSLTNRNNCRETFDVVFKISRRHNPINKLRIFSKKGTCQMVTCKKITIRTNSRSVEWNKLCLNNVLRRRIHLTRAKT